LTAIEWRLPLGEQFDDIALVGERDVVPTGLELQGESIAFVPTDGNYVHASEGRHTIIYRIPCR